MTGNVDRDRIDIAEQVDLANESGDAGSRWPGLSYEEGVAAALLWVTGHSDDAPMNDQ